MQGNRKPFRRLHTDEEAFVDTVNTSRWRMGGLVVAAVLISFGMVSIVLSILIASWTNRYSATLSLPLLGIDATQAEIEDPTSHVFLMIGKDVCQGMASSNLDVCTVESIFATEPTGSPGIYKLDVALFLAYNDTQQSQAGIMQQIQQTTRFTILHKSVSVTPIVTACKWCTGIPEPAPAAPKTAEVDITTAAAVSIPKSTTPSALTTPAPTTVAVKSPTTTSAPAAPIPTGGTSTTRAAVPTSTTTDDVTAPITTGSAAPTTRALLSGT